MIVAEKPPLDDDLLIHFGVKGMRWGHRKPEEVSTGGNRGSAAPKAPMSTGKKVAIGVGVAAGVAAAAYFLSKRGATPRTKALSSKSTRIGFKVAGRVMLRIGKMSANVATKTAKVTTKVGVKTATTTGRLGGQAVKKVSITSSQKLIESTTKAGQAIARSYNKIQAKRALKRSPEVIQAGSRFTRALVSRLGSNKPQT
jgi:hypothetical protein